MESCITRSYNVLKFLKSEKYLLVKKQKQNKTKKNTQKNTHTQYYGCGLLRCVLGDWHSKG